MMRAAGFLGYGVAVLLAPAGLAQVTHRVSVGSGGAQGSDMSFDPMLAADGQTVAFWSFADNLVGGDTNGTLDCFVRDRRTGATERASVDSNGIEGDNSSGGPTLSGDGGCVAFVSLAGNLVPGDTNGSWDVFVRDRQTGTTERISVDSGGAQGDGDSYSPSISADGRYVVFVSFAGNLVGVDTNAVDDVFLHDRQNGVTERLSVDSSGAQADGSSKSYGSAVSADGRCVTFYSYASNLVGGDTNGTWDVFVRDRQSGTTERVSVDSTGAQGNGYSELPSISADGRYVAFESRASNLVGGDTNATEDVFVHDRQSGTTERSSVSSGGAEGNVSSQFPAISSDGRYVAFHSSATNLDGVDANGMSSDIFVRDRTGGATWRVSLDSTGAAANGYCLYPSISSDGRFVAFRSDASNLVGGDTNGVEDAFVRDRDYSPFASLCDAGAGGVAACPCSNPPSQQGRGCDNSAGTGGAVLSASGVAYLSMDTLVFGMREGSPSELSIVVQADAPVPSGVVYGQGVRCAGGAFERLYVKTASGGSITAPDFGAGDASVSARSAAGGDPIEPGQSRWYLVYYRDPTVLGGCPATSTFNATQTGQVSWSP